MSGLAERIMGWYVDDMWSKERVLNVLAKGAITQEECDEILAAKKKE